LAHSSSRAVLAWTRACSGIHASSSLMKSASSQCVSFPSHARNSSTAVSNGTAASRPEGERGGSSLCKMYRDKSVKHRIKHQPMARDGRKFTFLRHSSNGCPPPSPSGEVAVTHHYDWSPHHWDAFHDHRRMPSPTNRESLERWARRKQVSALIKH
jgi:hypothetical protein